MILTKKMLKVISGDLEGMSEEDIKECEFMIAIHRPAPLHFGGKMVGCYTRNEENEFTERRCKAYDNDKCEKGKES